MARLARDPRVPRAARVRLWLLLAYLALPFDLVPDFIPVLGYADDAILVSWVLRSVIRATGPDLGGGALARHPRRPGRRAQADQDLARAG